jgi:hypothetical protein
VGAAIGVDWRAEYRSSCSVNGALDFRDARALQQHYHLTPAQRWGEAGAVVPERREVSPPAAQDPLGPMEDLNAMLAENPQRLITPFYSTSSASSASVQASTSKRNPPR